MTIVYSIDAIYGIYVYNQVFNAQSVMEEDEYFSHLDNLILNEETEK